MGQIKVKVIGARYLIAQDSNGICFHFGLLSHCSQGKSDPYCIIILGKQKKKTKVVKVSCFDFCCFNNLS